ncbi:MAG: hypothetical protein FJ042_07830 [Candidatus Cloacimonetes bacterium]|nr:hypothetical protein [Candidatus Cloacimonadota bacterium]
MPDPLKKIIHYFGPIRLIVILASIIISLILSLNTEYITPRVTLQGFKIENDSLKVNVRITNRMPVKVIVQPFDLRVSDGEDIKLTFKPTEGYVIKAFCSQTIPFKDKLKSEHIKQIEVLIQANDRVKLLEKIACNVEMEIMKVKGKWSIR